MSYLRNSYLVPPGAGGFMHEPSHFEAVSFETQSYHFQVDTRKFLAFSGWTLFSLCLWAGLIESVRLLF